MLAFFQSCGHKFLKNDLIVDVCFSGFTFIHLLIMLCFSAFKSVCFVGFTVLQWQCFTSQFSASVCAFYRLYIPSFNMLHFSMFSKCVFFKVCFIYYVFLLMGAFTASKKLPLFLNFTICKCMFSLIAIPA
jgi:hypothetical protein